MTRGGGFWQHADIGVEMLTSRVPAFRTAGAAGLLYQSAGARDEMIERVRPLLEQGTQAVRTKVQKLIEQLEAAKKNDWLTQLARGSNSK